MSELDQRLAGLSPEKRALLMQQLARRAAATAPVKADIGRRVRPERLPLSSAQQRSCALISAGTVISVHA